MVYCNILVGLALKIKQICSMYTCMYYLQSWAFAHTALFAQLRNLCCAFTKQF